MGYLLADLNGLPAGRFKWVNCLLILMGYIIGRRIDIYLSGIGYRILPLCTDRISDIGYRISESDISMNRLRIVTKSHWMAILS